MHQPLSLFYGDGGLMHYFDYFLSRGPPENPAMTYFFLTTILTTKYPAKADSITQYLAVSDRRR